MSSHSEKTLLAGVSADRYVGRLDQFERLYLHAVSGAEPFCVRISSPPAVGASELLRQVYDRLFREQRFVVPFYFAVRPGDATGEAAAARYLYQFLLQVIAFRRKDPALISASPDICELAKLAPLADADWVDRLCEACRNEGPLNNGRAFIRSALAAPLRAAAEGKIRVCVIIDDLHESAALEGGRIFIDELSAVFANAHVPVVLAARRQFAFPELRADTFEIGPMTREDAARLVEALAADMNVTLSEQTRDLIAVQLGGSPLLIRLFVYAAREKSRALASYRDVEQLYAEELLLGGIGDYFDDIFSRASSDPGVRRKLVEMLYFAHEPESERFPLSALRERLGISVSEFRRLAESLDIDEVIAIETGSAFLRRDNLLRDFLDTRYRLDHERSTAASVAASTVTNALKQAPQLMARVYRREAAAGLRDVMLLFDLQEVPRSLLDYRIFRDQYKGVSNDEVRGQLGAETQTIALPQISHAAPVAEHYSPFVEFIEPERATLGVGFTDRAYRDEDHVAWLAAEIDSKLEADYTLTGEWCDRLDQAAAASGFSNHRIWLVAPEGFSDGALDLLSERKGIGSSRRQVDLLRNFLKGDTGAEQSGAAEYEMVIPVGEDTELIAAHALEEITRRFNFPTKTINQIKTALVEACINASEHGLSPDRKIYQKFVVDHEKIVITISNRGLRLTGKKSTKPAVEIEPTEGRRGWGLNLMRGLMDEVRIESVDDGSRIVMTKYLKGPKSTA
jgi:serine/threonine-protein kinase RsbW